MSTLSEYQAAFVDFLVEAGVLTFGDFTTKSGRKTPYFVNTGKLDNGEKIRKAGKAYAAHMVHEGLDELDVIFGPSYKGVPLAVAASMSMSIDHNKTIGFCFNRKEAKTHGDKGITVGASLEEGSRIVIVEDVITAGTTFREVVPLLKEIATVDIRGVVIAVDRCERGSGTVSAVQEVSEELGLSIHPIVTVHQIVEYLSKDNASGLVLSPEDIARVHAYLEEYGA